MNNISPDTLLLKRTHEDISLGVVRNGWQTRFALEYRAEDMAFVLDRPCDPIHDRV